MTPSNSKPVPDLLQQARRHLDFGALAKSAPTAREVLYKAQTIVPLAPPKPWTRIAAGGTAVVAAAALVAAPWVPMKSSLVTVGLSLEKRLPRRDAQELITSVSRHLPGDVFMSADFGTDGNGPDDLGPLKLSFTALGRTGTDLSETVRRLMRENQRSTLQAQLSQPRVLSHTEWRSPLSLLKKTIRADYAPTSERLPGSNLARGLLARRSLIAAGLASRLKRVGYELTAFTFVRGPAESGSADFTVAAWPAPIGVSVRNYRALTAHEQAAVRRVVGEYLQAVNLSGGPLALVREPTNWFPVLVDVTGTDGLPDRYFTDKLQAWVEQPDSYELSSLSFDVVAVVEDALNRLVPGLECRMDYETVRQAPSAQSGSLYRVHVSLRGSSIRREPPPSAKRRSEEQAGAVDESEL